MSWTSGNNGIAQVSDAIPTKGLVTGVGVGSTAINSTLGGVHGSTTLTVTAATLVSLTIAPPDPSIAKATTTQLTATGNFSDGTTQDCTIQVSWTSGENSIAQVSNVSGTQGLVTGLAVGSTTISVALGDVQASTTLTVTATTLVEAKKQGPVLAWGNFVTFVINFILIAWVLFLAIKGMNRMRLHEEAKPAPPPRQEVLLEEIRDLLAKK